LQPVEEAIPASCGIFFGQMSDVPDVADIRCWCSILAAIASGLGTSRRKQTFDAAFMEIRVGHDRLRAGTNVCEPSAQSGWTPMPGTSLRACRSSIVSTAPVPLALPARRSRHPVIETSGVDTASACHTACGFVPRDRGEMGARHAHRPPSDVANRIPVSTASRLRPPEKEATALPPSVTMAPEGHDNLPMDSIRFTKFTFQRCSRRLARGEEDVAIGARAFDLLDFLIASRDRVVGRAEVMAAVWPDAVVGENNLNVQLANLRRLLGADAIVTVPGRGLRFALEVSSSALPKLDLPDRPSVMVLPFAGLGGDPGLSWLADGFVEDITTELSRFRDLFVVARNSAIA
jgi:DNA-binding winged helix-turn-helix (wHTH) protein